MNVEPAQVYILGGFASLYTALQLDKFFWNRSLKPQITLIDRNDRFLFTPFLYELITQEFQQWEIAPPYLRLLVSTDIQFCRGIVQEVDLNNLQLRLQARQVLTYERLVLAVGREAALNIIPGAATYALPFRTLADADRLKERLRYLEASEQFIMRIAIAGGGLSGVELAGKLADRLQQRGQIHLIERGATLLKSFTTFSQRTAHQILAAHQSKLISKPTFNP
jgi:NADH dehydrogenase